MAQRYIARNPHLGLDGSVPPPNVSPIGVDDADGSLKWALSNGAVQGVGGYVAASGDGAISVKTGIVFITKGTAAALTLAAPTAGTDDGKELTIMSTTAAAHTVTNSSPGFNAGGAGKDVATFAAAIGNNMVLSAYQGTWYVVSQVGITLA